MLAQSEDHNSDSSFESADEGYDADIDLPCRKAQVRNNTPTNSRISTRIPGFWMI